MATLGHRVYFLFVDKQYYDDYRIKIIKESGAIALQCGSIKTYHCQVRHWLYPTILRRLIDRLLSYTVATKFLRKNNISIIVNEWSGAYGRAMADYFLRAACFLQLPTVSLPHGYHIWCNKHINKYEVNLWSQYQVKPNFSDRNRYSAYVVQNTQAWRFNRDRGVAKETLRIMGSARFCPEWLSLNKGRIPQISKYQTNNQKCHLLFFVPDWEYNVDRDACVSLLERLSREKNVFLRIKANTRGTGSLTADEKTRFERTGNVDFPGMSDHSPLLIEQSDAVINFASSIGLEAILQGKPVCNPLYLNRNQTIFDNSGVVFDATSEDAVITFVKLVQTGNLSLVSGSDQSSFHREFVLGGQDSNDVLLSYANLLLGMCSGASISK